MDYTGMACKVLALTLLADRQKCLPARPQRAKARGVQDCVREGLSDAKTWLEALFTIPLTDGHHAVERDFRPALVVFRYHNTIYDMPFSKVLHSPTEMCRIDSEHSRALTNRG